MTVLPERRCQAVRMQERAKSAWRPPRAAVSWEDRQATPLVKWGSCAKPSPQISFGLHIFWKPLLCFDFQKKKGSVVLCLTTNQRSKVEGSGQARERRTQKKEKGSWIYYTQNPALLGPRPWVISLYGWELAPETELLFLTFHSENVKEVQRLGQLIHFSSSLVIFLFTSWAFFFFFFPNLIF